MANLTIDATKVRYAKGSDQNQLTAPANEAISAGDVVRLDGTTGRWAIANATDAANLGDPHIALRTVKQYEALTAVRGAGAMLDLGEALAALSFGDKVYVSDTAGKLGTTAGTVSKVAGTVVPGFASTTADKLLRVDL